MGGGIDYHVGLACGIKRRFSLVQLAPIVRHPDPTELANQHTRALDGAEGAEPLVVRHPGEAGLAEISVPHAEVVRRAEAVTRFRRKCRDCPANLGRPPGGFGCFGHIPLPIPAAAEHAVMAVVERTMEGGEDVDPGAGAPIRFIWDNGLDGAHVSAQRSSREVMEAEAPVVCRVGPFLEKREISSDQVLQQLLGTNPFRMEYAVLFGPFLSEFGRLARDLWRLHDEAGQGESAEPPIDPVDVIPEPFVSRPEMRTLTPGGAPGEAIDLDAVAPLMRFLEAVRLAGELGVDTHLTPLVPVVEVVESAEEG